MLDGYLKMVDPGAVGQKRGTYNYNVHIDGSLPTFVTKVLFAFVSMLE